VVANQNITTLDGNRVGRMLMASYVCGTSSDTYSKYTTANTY
jgi:hypothetical protein